MKTKALLVGINKYNSQQNLAGCINDIEDVAKYLVESCKFNPETIRLLSDERATAKGILERLEWLVQDVEPGDKIVFHYSGHGAQYPSRGGSGEIDDLLEVICPCDFNWDEDKMITDKQFVSLFSKIPNGTKMLWLCDSCHSGDLTRSIYPMRGYRGPTVIYRTIPIPADIAWRYKTVVLKNLTTKPHREGLHLVFVSGCQSDQVSADTSFGGRPNGSFTYYFLKSCYDSPGKSIESIVTNTSELLAANKFSQRPSLEGAIDFGSMILPL